MNAKLIALVFLGLGLASAQTIPSVGNRMPFPVDSPPASAEEFRLRLIQRLLTLPTPVTNGRVQLARMGDEAAVDILKILGVKGALNPGETKAAVDIIHMAFDHIDGVANPLNRQPQAALAALKHLSLVSDDPEVKGRIENEISRLLAMKGQK